MPKTSLTFIDQEAVKRDFKFHLNEESNKRILFSARFGAGKSTFLKHFFEDEDIAKNYLALKLYPVNYSIAHNKDVFELVKYDIIYELLSKYSDKIDLKQEDYSNLLLGQIFLLHGFKIDPLIKSILKITNPESEVYNEITEKLSDIFKQYSTYKDEVVKDHNKMLLQYIRQLKHHKGSPHEYDDISELITIMLENIMEAKVELDVEQENIVEAEVVKKDAPHKPKTVLIIDDLDRLDPEHIFRLFNIFSAHYDSVTDENKFGFDKVIFVCDYDNIRLMYEHRYGKGVDFSGYIDKFYSIDVFSYDNRRYIKNKLIEIFKKKPQVIPEKMDNEYGPGRNHFYAIFECLLNALLEVNAFTLRNLEQFDYYDFPKYKFTIGRSDIKYQAGKYPFLILIHLLEKILTKESLKKHLTLISEKLESSSIFINSSYYSEEQIAEIAIKYSLYFIIDPDIVFNQRRPENNSEEKSIQVDYMTIYYLLNFNWDTDTRSVMPTSIIATTANMTIEHPNFFRILLEAVIKIDSLSKYYDQ